LQVSQLEEKEVEHQDSKVDVKSMDLADVLREKVPDMTDNMMTLICSMVQNSTVTPHGRRWDRAVIQMALQLWNRSAQGYADMISMGFLVLPSIRLLQMYKNVIHQKPGIQKDMLKWMLDTAGEKKVPWLLWRHNL
jgi:hypothetical protein